MSQKVNDAKPIVILLLCKDEDIVKFLYLHLSAFNKFSFLKSELYGETEILFEFDVNFQENLSCHTLCSESEESEKELLALNSFGFTRLCFLIGL